MKVDDKSNKITAIPELLKMLDIHGCFISIDVIDTHTEIVSTIFEQGEDYLFGAKQNQGVLYDQTEFTFRVDRENNGKDVLNDYDKKANKAHGRIDTRECWGVSDPEYLNFIDPDGHWNHLKSLAVIEAASDEEGETSSQIRLVLSTVEVGAGRIMQIIQRHWEVETNITRVGIHHSEKMAAR